jgi:hypothetical protein
MVILILLLLIQCAGNANAYFGADIAPYQIPGSNFNQQTGNEILLTSFYLQLSRIAVPFKHHIAIR